MDIRRIPCIITYLHILDGRWAHISLGLFTQVVCTPSHIDML